MDTPVTSWARRACHLHPTGYDVGFRRSWATTWASRLGHCADMNGAPLTRTPPRRSWGRGPPPTGWRRIQARRATCLLRVFYCELCSAPTGRVPGLRGAFIIASTPSLLCWFRGPTSRYCCAVECLDSVAFLSYLLTYLTYQALDDLCPEAALGRMTGVLGSNHRSRAQRHHSLKVRGRLLELHRRARPRLPSR